MENNQHNSEQNQNSQNIEILRGRQPGQQPPATETPVETESTHAPDEKDEKHSESSLPKHDNETLGTP